MNNDWANKTFIIKTCERIHGICLPLLFGCSMFMVCQLCPTAQTYVQSKTGENHPAVFIVNCYPV